MTVLVPTVTRSADGGPVNSYATLVSTWCSRYDKGSREFRITGATTDETTSIFTARWTQTLAGVKGSYRIEQEGRTWEVTAPPREVDRRRLIVLEAKENKSR